jgi:integrase
MSLYKRGKTYYVSIYSKHRGRVKCSTKTSDRGLAQRFHDELKAKLWKEEFLNEQPDRLWDEAAILYLKEAQYRATFPTIQQHVKKLREYLQGRKLKEITPDVVDWIREKRLKDGVSNSTVNRMLEILRAMLRMAVDRDWIIKAPKIRMLPEPKTRPRFLTQDEEARLMAELPDHLRAMACFSLATGLRERNVTQLRWEQVDLDRKCCWVHADEAKAGHPIAVPLNIGAMKVLVAQRGQHEVYVFVHRGSPVVRANNTAWKKALKRAGIKNFRWHDLRSTFASRHVMAGTPLYDLQKLGGWQSQAMIQRYAALSAEHLAEVAENVSKNLGPKKVPSEVILH